MENNRKKLKIFLFRGNIGRRYVRINVMGRTVQSLIGDISQIIHITNWKKLDAFLARRAQVYLGPGTLKFG